MKYYIRTNQNGGIVDISEDNAFGGAEVESNDNLVVYLINGLCGTGDTPKYKLLNGAVTERTAEEIASDSAMPTNSERLTAVEAAVLETALGGAVNG